MSNATEALKATVKERKAVRMLTKSESEQLKPLMAIFVEAVRVVDPLMVFTVVDIIGWAHKYAETENIELPVILQKTHTLGKVLSKCAEDFELVKQGTYGNRQVYTLMGADQ